MSQMELLDYLYEINAELESQGKPFVKPADLDLVVPQVIGFIKCQS